MSYRFALLSVAILGIGCYIFSPPKAMSATDSQTPVVLELFTSQSCSSCPPADKLLGTLSSGRNIIVLGCHVTYWDHLLWKDTLSHDFCTTRQHTYAKDNDRNQVFTPELIVNGRNSMIGSKEIQIRDAIKKNDGLVKPVTISANKDGSFTATLPSLPHTKSIINLVTFSAPVTQNIGSGENSGNSVTYIHAVQSIDVVKSDWNGDTQSLVIKPNASQSGAGFAILVQEGASGTGPILAAGQYQAL